MIPCTVCGRILRKKKKTVASTAMTMSAIDTDGNAANDSCGQYFPKDVPDITETDPQSHYEYITACLPSGTADPRYFEAPWNAPKVMCMVGDGRPSPEYETVEDAFVQQTQEEYCTMRYQ